MPTHVFELHVKSVWDIQEGERAPYVDTLKLTGDSALSVLSRLLANDKHNTKPTQCWWISRKTVEESHEICLG